MFHKRGASPTTKLGRLRARVKKMSAATPHSLGQRPPVTSANFVVSSRWKGENVATTEVADVVGLVDFVQEVNVYGVPVPGRHSRL